MAWYKTGTVSVTNASTTVTGSGTNFVSGAQVGEAFQGPDGELYEITVISSATSLTITPAYGGATASGQSYAIVPTQSLVADLASDVADLISDYQTVVDEAGAGKFGDGSAASPSISFVQDQDTGFFRDTANEIAVSIGGTKIGEFNASGLSMTTGINADGGLTFGDNDKAIFGAGNDLQIYHDGSHSYISDVGTGNLRIRGTDITLQDADGNGYISMVDGGAGGTVYLKHLGSNVLATTSTGIDVTGTVTLDDTLNISGGSTTGFLQASGTSLQLGASTASDLIAYTNNTERMRIDSSGNVGIGTSSPASLLHLESAEPIIRFKDSDGSAYHQIFGNTTDLYIDADRGNNATSNIIFRNDATERMRIDSSGNVGIGDATPSQKLDVNGNIRVTGGFVEFSGDTSTPSAAAAIHRPADNTLAFSTLNTERMRIDSSGNLLVGKTSADNTTVGTTIYGDNAASMSIVRSGASQLILNRLSTDGDMAVFRKDGTTVGSIGTSSSNAYISGATRGLHFTGTAGIIPCNEAGAARDADTNLGTSSTRFKDLYLSGGVYLGGTGASNLLDDYEEGTWTPDVSYAYASPTYVKQVGKYTKVGNLVTAYFFVDLSSSTTSGLNAKVQGFPFTAVNNTDVYIVGNGYVNETSTKGLELKWLLFPNSTEARLYEQQDTGVTSVSSNTTGSTPSMLFSFTYYTS